MRDNYKLYDIIDKNSIRESELIHFKISDNFEGYISDLNIDGNTFSINTVRGNISFKNKSRDLRNRNLNDGTLNINKLRFVSKIHVKYQTLYAIY